MDIKIEKYEELAMVLSNKEYHLFGLLPLWMRSSLSVHHLEMKILMHDALIPPSGDEAERLFSLMMLI